MDGSFRKRAGGGSRGSACSDFEEKCLGSLRKSELPLKCTPAPLVAPHSYFFATGKKEGKKVCPSYWPRAGHPTQPAWPERPPQCAFLRTARPGNCCRSQSAASCARLANAGPRGARPKERCGWLCGAIYSLLRFLYSPQEAAIVVTR